jgi:aromatic-L-amino-acid decarboxylase
VADRKPLIDTLSIVRPYLRDAATDTGEVIDYRDWHISLGRRFRALKLWWVLRSYGAQGLRALLREHVALAQELGRRIDAHDRLERVAPVSFALVCFAHADGNEATDAIARAINAEPTLSVTPSSVGDTRFVRVAIGQTRTTAADVERLWRVIDRAA